MNMIGPFALIITDAVKSNANAAWELIDPDVGGYNTFTVGLSPSGAANATHWACNTWLEPECADALLGTLNPDGTRTALTNTQFTAFLQMRSDKLGRPMPNNPGQFRAQFNISAQGADFWAFIQSLGLKTIQEATGQGK